MYLVGLSSSCSLSNGLAARQSPGSESDMPLARRQPREKTRLVLAEQLVMDSPQKALSFQEPWAEQLALGFAVAGSM